MLKLSSRVRPALIALAAAAWTLCALTSRAGEAPGEIAAPQGIVGSWNGTLKVGTVELRLVVRVAKLPDGTYAGMLDAPDSGRKAVPTDKIVFARENVVLEFKQVPVRFEGALSKDGSEISGTWTQAGRPFPLSFHRAKQAPERRNRPQEPKRPFPYVEEEVTYENQKARVRLAGTLTRPKGSPPYPAVLLLSGTGPHDRDESLFGHRPFLVLADYLTRRGVAVLRVDDRGVGQSSGDFAKATLADFADDALAGLAFLKSRPELDGQHIGLIGHSEGGSVAILAASRSNGVAFLLTMAGPGVAGSELAQSQAAAMLKAAGATDRQIEQNRRLQQAVIEVLNRVKDDRNAETELRRLLIGHVATLSAAEKRSVGDPTTFVENQVKQWLMPGFRYYVSFDPAQALSNVRCPFLALNGENDLVVSCTRNLAAIKSALERGGNTDITVKALPRLNHLFQTCETGTFDECPRIEETISPVALQEMAAWLEQKAATGAGGQK